MKKLLTILLSVFMALTLVACGGGNDEPTGKVSVEVWHTYTEGQKAYLEEAAANFNAEHDDIEVIIKEQAYQGFVDTVYNAVMNNNGPDMIIHYASEAAKYVPDNKVADLSKYVPSDYASTLAPSVYKEATSFEDGKLHLLPFFVSGPVMFIHKGLYEELNLEIPTTWEELAENSAKIKAAYPEKYGFAVDSKTDVMHALISQTDNELIDLKTKTVTFNTPEVAERLEWFGKNVADGLFVLDPSGDYFSNDFNAGLIGSYIGSVAGIPYLEQGTYEVAPIPQGSKVEWTSAWNRGAIVFSYDDEAREAAAAQFAMYLASPEVNAKFCAVANYATPYPATAATETYKAHIADNPALESLRPEIGGAIAPITGAATVRKVLETMAASSVGKDAAGIKEILTNGEAEANAALAGE